MYQVTCDDVVIYDLRLDDRIILSPKLDLEVGKNGTFSFIILTSNPAYNLIQQKKSILKVYQVDKYEDGFKSTEIFRGTAYNVTIDFYKRKQVECEGELSFFNDSIVRPYSYQGNVEDLFKLYVNNHNNQVNASKRFIPRNCNVVDSNDYITRANSNYPSTKSEIDNKLINSLGGHFETGDNEDGTRYIDYIQNYERVSSQIIQFGINMLDLTQHIQTENLATRIVPIGAKNEETGEKLTIKSVNDGKDYIQDDSAIALFEVIEEMVEFSDVTVASNLLRKGEQVLQDRINASVSIELSASDLHNIDVNIEAFRVGDNVRVISIPHRLDRYFLLSKLHLELDNLSSCSMTLGAVFKSFTQKQFEAQKQIANALKSSENIVTEVSILSTNVSNVSNKVDNFIVEVPQEYVNTEYFENYKNDLNDKMKTFISESDADEKYAAKSDLDNYVEVLDFEELVKRVENLEKKKEGGNV